MESVNDTLAKPVLLHFYIATGYEPFLQEILKMLTNGNSLSYEIIGYMMYGPNKSKHASTILELNKKYARQK
jgi:hypothetical protein